MLVPQISWEQTMTSFDAQQLADTIFSVISTPFDLSLGSENDLVILMRALEKRSFIVNRSSILPMTLTITPPSHNGAAKAG